MNHAQRWHHRWTYCHCHSLFLTTPLWSSWSTGRAELQDQSSQQSHSRSPPSARLWIDEDKFTFVSWLKVDWLIEDEYKVNLRGGSGSCSTISGMYLFTNSPSLFLKTLINQKVFLRTTFGILTSGSESVTVNGQERFGTFNKLAIIFHKDKRVIIRIMRTDRLCWVLPLVRPPAELDRLPPWYMLMMKNTLMKMAQNLDGGGSPPTDLWQASKEAVCQC